MALSKTMEDAIREKDLGKIYSSFYTILLSDPGFSTGKFDEAFEAVKRQNISGFIQDYNGIPFEDESQWSQQYWDRLASELMDNFCLERIEHLKKVSSKVYAKHQNVHEPTQKKTEQMQVDVYQRRPNTGRLIVIVGGVLLLLILILVLVF